MDLILTNPVGLWALLGIPAVLAIHLLQRQPRHHLSSTLFLLKRTLNESRAGHRIERLRASIPLWLQLLIVLLITWLLVSPRWQRSDSIQRTAIVIDSSASMQAFKPELLAKLPTILSQLSTHAGRKEFIIIDSTLHAEPLYHGNDTSALLARLSSWQPLQGAHNFTPALEVAHSLVGTTGSIILISDHAIEDLPFNSQLFAIGEKIANVGFTGFRLIENESKAALSWRALVKNYSDTPQQREWAIQIGGQLQTPRPLTLQPGQTLTLSGTFPADIDQFVLTLTADSFPLDDQLPVLRPLTKTLTFGRSIHPDYDTLINQVLGSLPNVSAITADSSNPTTDLIIASYDPLSPSTPDHPAIIAIHDPLGTDKTLRGQIVASQHPLTEGLIWQGLVARRTLQIPMQESDDVLLWQGQRPMIFLRKIGAAPQLIFNFDLTASNAARLPAFIIMISRFAEQIRAAKVAPIQLNAETNQRLTVANHLAHSEPLVLRWQSSFGDGEKIIASQRPQALPRVAHTREVGSTLTPLRAPQAPGTFQLSQGNTSPPLVRGATFFADTREADFSLALSVDTLDALTPALVQQHTRSDPYWRIWIALTGILILLNWHFITRPTS